jgi:hypothetical protein
MRFFMHMSYLGFIFMWELHMKQTRDLNTGRLEASVVAYKYPYILEY